jgi:predicted ATPase
MTEHHPFIQFVTLLSEKVPSFDRYPFSIPAIKHLRRLEIHPCVTFFAGENGTGKSTLLEAIAAAEGINVEGGSRNFSFSTNDNLSALKNYVRLERPFRSLRKTDAYFFRAESFYNVASEMERLGIEYGETSLHRQSHGEGFLSLVMNRFYGNGLYLLDEPEAALSPLRQLSFLAAIHDLSKSGSQFIIATHSPIIMAYPNAVIYWFSGDGVAPIQYTDTEHYKTTRTFIANPMRVLKELMSDGGQDTAVNP